MSGALRRLLVENLQPAPGKRGWHGGPTPVGALRGVSAEAAWWSPGPKRRSIWALTLHLAYWKYAVRRRLTGEVGPRFVRAPANWPMVPDRADPDRWAADVALLRAEHRRLLEAVAAVPLDRLGDRPAGGRSWTYGELILGIAQHDAYHTGQIQLLKRLWLERGHGGRR
ncbi:MAG TPA: DinB family protein [Gemmatimonadales bacterium]|nr:DinB family protein [Gemmatimonadales bacterium]